MSLREEKFREMKNSFRALNKISQHFYYKKKLPLFLKNFFIIMYMYMYMYVIMFLL